MRNKEDILMRDLLLSSSSFVNATGGTNGDTPTNIASSDISDVEVALLGNDAKNLMEGIEATDQFGTGPVRDSYIALCHTDLVGDLRDLDGFKTLEMYPGDRSNLRPEEEGTFSRFRFFISSKGGKILNASLLGNDRYDIPMYGLEAFAKLEQNKYSAVVGYRPPELVSSVKQNSELYAKFAIARAITNQSWLTLLRCTLST